MPSITNCRLMAPNEGRLDSCLTQDTTQSSGEDALGGELELLLMQIVAIAVADADAGDDDVI